MKSVRNLLLMNNNHRNLILKLEVACLGCFSYDSRKTDGQKLKKIVAIYENSKTT